MLLGTTAALAADLQVSSYVANSDPIAATATGSFSVRVANNGVATINNAVVTIAISDRFQVVNAAGNFPAFCAVAGAVGSQVLTCNMPALLGGSANSQTFSYNAVAINVGTANSTATIAAAGNSDSNAANNAITISTTVRAAADLSIAKAGSSANVIAGGALQYTLTIANAGPSTTAAVTVVDTLPASSDFNYQSAAGSNWTCGLASGRVTCTYSGSAPAAGTNYPPITISGTIAKDTAGTISNIANVVISDPLVLDPNGANDNSNIVVTTIRAGSDLRAIKSMPATITVGQSTTIALSINNSGPQTAPAGTTITDTVDASLTLGTMPPGCSRSGQNVTCTAGALSSGAQADFAIPVTGASGTAGTLTNSAQITPPAGFSDPDLSNNTATAPFSVVVPHADLELYSKTKSPNPIAPGADITSVIVVRNLGPSAATYNPANPIRITDTLSAAETYVSADPAWSCSVGGTVVSCQSLGSGTLAVGDTITLTLITKAGAGVDANVTNIACTGAAAGSSQLPASSVSASGADCRSAGVRSTTQAADLSVIKDVSLSPGGGWTKNLSIADTVNTFYIRLQVSNAAGSDTARTVNVSDVMPNYITSGSFITGVTQQSATAGTMSYNNGNGLVSWNVTNLAGGQTETLIIKVDRPFESGSFTNFASVFSPDTTEISTANNTDSAAYTAAAIADLAINSKTISPDPARVGVPAIYIISVVNNGANPGDNVQVRDVIDPNKFEITGPATTTKPGATCTTTIATGTVVCDMGQFVRTELAQVNVPVLPKYPFGSATLASLPAANTNVATVTTSTRDSNGGTDPNAGNNTFTLNHTVQSPTFDLAVTKVETDPVKDDPIHFGETLNYDIRISNFGPSRATDVVLTDLPSPPAGMTISLASVAINPVSANSGLTLQAAPNAACTASGANYICKIDPGNQAANYLDPGKQVVFRTVFTVGGPAPSVSTTFTNTAQVTSAEQPTWNGAGADTTTTNNQAVQTTSIRPTTDLEILSKTRTGALQRDVDEPLEYTIRFRNNGPSGASKVVVTDVLPAGFVFVAAPAPSTVIPAGSGSSVSAVSCSGTTTIACIVTGNFPVGAGNTVDLKLNVKAQAPYSGALTPSDSTNTATITPGLDSAGELLSEDDNAVNDSQSAVVQISPSSIAGTVYADNNGNNAIDGGEGIAGVTVTLTGTDFYGNPISATALTNASGAYFFGALPPSDASGYTIVETQPAAYYDLNETAGTSGGTVNNASYGNSAAQNTIAAIRLAPSTNATGYLFQDHAKAVIVAANDNPPSVNGGTGQTNLTNAFTNDTFNNQAINVALINVTIVTPASNPGVSMDPLTGNVSVAAGTPAGTYTIDYQICDKADPTVCATARVTVIVTAPAIAAVNDTISGVNGATGATNVLAALTGDTLNGAAVTTSNVTITLASGSIVPAVLTFVPATGATSVNPDTPAGIYSFNYQICETLNPGNCAIATETVSVVAGPIAAVNDAAAGINGASGAANVLNVLTGDTRNGAAATIGNVTIALAPGATVPAGLTFDTATGNISVTAGTPAGTYFFNYRICETINPTNCAIAEARVTVVAAPITAASDSVGGIVGATGGTNLLTALTGDTLNGVAATTGTVTITLAPGATVPAGLTFTPATGTTSVAAGTPAGTYSFDYRICENLNPTSCAIATETVTVVPAPIAAVNDSASGINGATGAPGVLNVLTGDTLNAAAATAANVNIALATGATVPAGLTFDTATGSVSVVSGTPAGTYSFDYKICEKLNPTNCTTATASVTVVAAPIAATNDTVTGINGLTGANNVLSALTGDTLDGAPATTGTVTISLPVGVSVPAGLTFDTATGNVSVSPNTPAGPYSFTYKICEKLNPANCTTAIESVTVVAAPIAATNDTAAPVVGASGAAGVVNALANDTLNNNPVAASSVVITVTAPATPIGSAPVPVLNTATGLVDVPAGTPADSYAITYRICEALNPANCANATITVPVTAAAIAAANDSVGGINGASGAANVLNVLTGDTLNGAAATTANVTIGLAAGAVVPAGLTFDTATGNISVTTGTPAGTYSFDYRICEKLNPANCTTATATVTVVATPIAATNDSATGVNGRPGASNVLNALTGDTLNGAPATTATVTISLPTGVNVPAGLSFDPATGNVSVAPNTPAGPYSFDYKICEKLNPANCTTATETVTVVAAAITAATDTAPAVNGASGGTGVINALTNDTLNNSPVVLADIVITVTAPAAPIGGAPVPVLNPATGLVDVPAGTPAGNYTITYRICEVLNPANCANATITVPVTTAAITAASESVGGINGTTGATNVLAALTGDTLNGAAATTATVTITLAPGAVVPAGLVFDPATGSTTVNPATPAGTYSFDYRICEKLNPTNCATATETVTVIAAPIVAANDSVGGVNGASGAPGVLNVLTGDTLNGAPATTATVTIGLAPGALVPAGLAFDPATGNIAVNPATPAGTYSFDYRICEKLNPANCATATATVTVIAAPIVATSDSAGGINGASGAANVLAALTADTLNGGAATTATVTVSLAPGAVVPAGLAFDPATGSTTVNPGTPAGTYSFDYRICEKLNPTNCATATETIAVIAAPIVATSDSVGGINGASGALAVLNALTADTLNGAPATLSTVTVTLAPGATVPAGLVFTPATGSTAVNPGTPAGTYSFDYTVCEKLNPANCATATETVTVVAAPIVAANDSVGGVNGASGGAAVLNVLTGDTLNGAPATLGTVTITLAPGALVPAGLTFDPATGDVSVTAGTPAGSYSFDYRICEKLNPANCATATGTVTVIAAPIAATNDTVGGINGATGATNVLAALTGDTLNGAAASSAEVTVSLASGATVPAGLVFDPATGSTMVSPGTPAGTYSFGYTICEKLNPTNCATATETVTVIAAPIAATPDTIGGVNGAAGAAGVVNVLTGDTLNGSPVTISTVTIAVAPGATVPAGLAFDPATGNVSVNPGTPAGSYSFDYRICEKLNPANCATATVTVTVTAAPIAALGDSVTGVNGGTGAAGVLTALTGDTLNGAPATLTSVTVALAPGATVPAGLTFDPATGNVSVNPGAAAGTYSFGYTICEKLNPTNCATATETVTVVAGPIAATPDTATGVNGATGAPGVLNVLTGDTLNGTAATIANVTVTLAPGAVVPASLTFDPATGNVSVVPGTPAGSYSFDYKICEKLNPANCATATVTVTVIAAPIVATSDTVGGINGGSGAPNAVNAFAGDTINGQPATPVNAVLTLAPGAVLATGITFDPATGNVGVAPGTADGTYRFDYRICEKLNPANCTIATVTVTVVAPRSAVSGIVYNDNNINRTHENNEPLRQSWIVEVLRGGVVVATATTDANGFYSIGNLLSGADYTIQFRNPANSVVFGKIANVTLPANATLPNQDLPIDPSGVVYDAITRQPVAGALVTLVDTAGTPIPATCFLDPSQARQATGADGMYQFNIVPGSAASCPVSRTEYRLQIVAPTGYAPPLSTILLPQAGAFNASGKGNPAPVVANAAAPQASQQAVYYLGFLLAAGDGDVVNNHIPLDPFLTRLPLVVTKTSDKRTANVGDLVSYTITVRNVEGSQRAGVSVVDILPPGFKYVVGSARVNNVPTEPVVSERELRWNNQLLAGNSTTTYQLITVIGAGVTTGDRINTGVARNGFTNGDVSNRAQAIVSIVPSAIFDCAEIIGKVFDDLNGDGYQQQGEPGIPAARVATVNGQLITTDEHGRYHITCAAVPDGQIGSNFVLKLDTRTIPEGYTPTSDNPQSIRLTRGKISELNFGIQKARVVHIDLDQRAFVAGSSDLQSAFAQRLPGLKTIKAARLVIQLNYAAAQGETNSQIEARLDGVKARIAAEFREGWDGPPPVIEANITTATAALGRE